MMTYHAEVIGETGRPELPAGALVRVELFHHDPFITPTPRVTVRTLDDVLIEIPSALIRILTPAEAKVARARLRRGRRETKLADRRPQD